MKMKAAQSCGCVNKMTTNSLPTPVRLSSECFRSEFVVLGLEAGGGCAAKVTLGKINHK